MQDRLNNQGNETYSTALKERMVQSGSWETVSPEVRAVYSAMTPDAAREVLLLHDERPQILEPHSDFLLDHTLCFRNLAALKIAEFEPAVILTELGTKSLGLSLAMESISQVIRRMGLGPNAIDILMRMDVQVAIRTLARYLGQPRLS